MMDKSLLIHAIKVTVKRYPLVFPYLSPFTREFVSDNGEYKRVERDPSEPGLPRKKRAESRLKRLIAARLARQRKAIEEALKKGQSVTYLPDDDKERALLIREFYKNTLDGIELTQEGIGFYLSDGAVNQQALQYAESYVTEWLRALDDVLLAAVREAVTTFPSRPGVTVGDIVEILSPYFGEDRAWRIATTETTRIYAESNQIYANELAKEYPDFQVIKRYYTNNDDRVCPICAPQNGKEAPHNDEFAIPNPPLHVNCRCWTSVTVKA
jgi:SPP1 gp7 family putative phage head morphogenesis protein